MKYKVAIKGIGSYLPSKVVSNLDLEKVIDTTDEWIFTKLGIKERRVVESETVADMGYEAALQALEDARVSKEDLDMIIVATSSPSQISPINCLYNTPKTADIVRQEILPVSLHRANT